MYISKIKLGALFLLMPTLLFSQVQLRDSIITWQHHSFQLNADNSVHNYSTASNVRQQVHYNAKVIENELIRLVVIPEYGARVISFVYKPSGHENEEGIFRISENIETPGMKFWTWGKNNVDNNLFDFSNGGADNYIELWAGVSESFFTDATLSPQEEKSWLESYSPTMALSSISKINRKFAVNIGWNQDKAELYYELLAFYPNLDYQIKMYLNGEIILTAQKEISILSTGIDDFLSESSINKSINIRGDKTVISKKVLIN